MPAPMLSPNHNYKCNGQLPPWFWPLLTLNHHKCKGTLGEGQLPRGSAPMLNSNRHKCKGQPCGRGRCPRDSGALA